MEQTTRFFFDHWKTLAWIVGSFLTISFITIKLIEFIFSDRGWRDDENPKVVKAVDTVAVITMVIIIFVVPFATLYIFQYAGNWWHEISVQTPNVSIQISPVEGAYSQGQIIDLQLELVNWSSDPITNLQITFPKSLSDNIVIDYLHATYTMALQTNSNNIESHLVEWVFSAPSGLLDPLFPGKQLSANINVLPGNRFTLTVPIQFTGFGNFSGDIEIKVEVINTFIVTPIGPYGRDPTVTNNRTQKFPFSWTVLQKVP